MREVIAKPNHFSFFWKVKSHLVLERKCMYASRAGNDGYGAPVEKELVKNILGCVWILILERLALNWYQYQICHGIVLDHCLDDYILRFGILIINQFRFLFGCT
jgi:hypothetical protein